MLVPTYSASSRRLGSLRTLRGRYGPCRCRNGIHPPPACQPCPKVGGASRPSPTPCSAQGRERGGAYGRAVRLRLHAPRRGGRAAKAGDALRRGCTVAAALAAQHSAAPLDHLHVAAPPRACGAGLGLPRRAPHYVSTVSPSAGSSTVSPQHTHRAVGLGPCSPPPVWALQAAFATLRSAHGLTERTGGGNQQAMRIWSPTTRWRTRGCCRARCSAA